jgi:cell division protein FtsW
MDRTMKPMPSENHVGRGLLLTALALLGVGVVMVPSALDSVGAQGAWYARAGTRHILFAVAAGCVLLLAWRLDYQLWTGRTRFPWPAAGLLVVALVFGVLVFVPSLGRSVGGYRRWIRLGPPQFGIGFQPSELIKVATVVFLSAWLTRPGADPRSFWRSFLPAVLLVGVCLGVVITQDFGTAVVIALSACTTLWLAGVRWTYLAGLALGGGGALLGMLAMDPRRWLRIEAMLDPSSASNPSTYQLRQSLTTIATGGWFGKGLGLGMMKRGFLPEDSTDFLFAVICEEWGFVGAVGVLSLIAAWVTLSWWAAVRSQDRFGRTLAGSLGFVVAIQAMMHVAVNLGCLPPTGIAFPLVSAGGTSLLLTACAVSMVVSVSARPSPEDLRCSALWDSRAGQVA